MRKLACILVLVILFVPSCDIKLLDGAESSLNPPHDIATTPDGLTGYSIVDLDDVVIEGEVISLPPEFQDYGQTALMGAIVPSIADFFGGNHFARLLEALGINIDDIFNKPDIFPSTRSIVTENRLLITDEGVMLTDDYETRLQAYVDHLDLMLNADSPAFMRFLFNALDGYKWNYSPSRASMNGKLGLSGLVSMESMIENAALSAYLDVEFYDVQIGSFDFEVSGSSIPLYFPDTGTLHIEAQASFASSMLSYVVEDTTGAGGLDRPDGGGEVIYDDVYCPFLATLVVKESAYFDAKMLYDAIRKMVTSSSLTGEALWNEVCSHIWPDTPAPYITLTIYIPDIGDGSSRTLSASDWTLFQFFF